MSSYEWCKGWKLCSYWKLLTFTILQFLIHNTFKFYYVCQLNFSLQKYLESLYLITRKWYHTIRLPLESWVVSRLLHLRSDAACASLILILSMWDERALTLFMFILLLIILLKAYAEWCEMSDAYVLLICSRQSLSNYLLFTLSSMLTFFTMFKHENVFQIFKYIWSRIIIYKATII